MRLFTAIALPEEVRSHLEQVMREGGAVARDVSWTRPSKLHLTLKFIGDVPDSNVPGVINSLEPVLIKSPLELCCSGMVCFPPAKPARIIAADITGDINRLATLFENIETALTGVCRKEHRPYRPHVTLGRCKHGLGRAQREAIERTVAHLFPSPAFMIDEFALISSDKGIYTVCHHFG